MISRLVPLVSALTIIGPSAVRAQTARSADPPVERKTSTVPADAPVYARQGMWFGFGLGAGAASLHCSICGGDQQTRGTSGYLRVGTTVTTKLLVGAEVNGWMRAGGGADNQRVVALTGNGYWYPNPRHGYYLKTGFGITRYRQWSKEENSDVTTGLSTNGLGGQVGAGYEVRVNPKMSFLPYINLVGTANGSMSTVRDDGTRYERNKLSTGAHVLLVQIGVGVTWH